MPKQGRRVEFQLRFWFICAALMLIATVVVFRGQDAKAQRLQEQLTQLQEEEYAEGLRGDRLRGQIQMSETAGSRERDGRRRFGYVRPGVTRFVAENPPMDFPDGEPLDASLDSVLSVSNDWASFGN